MAAATAELQLDLGFTDASRDDDWFDALVAINQRWLSSYARLNPSFGVSPSLLERNSLWMNTHFQKHRMITSPLSKQAKTLLSHHQKTVLARLRAGGGGTAPSEMEWSTTLVEPMAALMFAASADRCPEYQIESLLTEAHELLQSRPLRSRALCSGFAGCVFRFLTASTETSKRILTLQLLVLLATDDAAAVVHSCKIAAQGQLWQPNMFIYTLQKRHFDNETICDLAAKLLALLSVEMPIASPIKIDSARYEVDEGSQQSPIAWNPPPSRLDPSPAKRSHTLPAITNAASKKAGMSPHRPTTTISALYVGSPSPYSSNVILPIARPPPSATEQARRSLIYSTPKEKAVAGDLKRRCMTPNIVEVKREPSASEDFDWMNNSSPPKSPTSPRAEKKPIVLSEKYSWNPDCINSVSGFEWWWRSLPQHHTNLEPTQKLKMVTKAAVRLHTKGEWERAVELYLLALSMNVNDEVAFRLRVNLGCAYEVGHDVSASEAAFRAALLINSGDPYARFKLGSSLKELGRYDEAAEAYNAVLDAYPQAKDALEQLEEAKQEKIKREEAERVALASARTARSPSKPGRRLLSRGNSTNASLPHLVQPASPAETPRPDRVAATANTVDDLSRAGGSSSGVETNSNPAELISCIEEKRYEKKVDLRATLRMIDSDLTGQIRLTALTKLLSALCGVDEGTFLGWLPHDAVQVDANGVVQYGTLLDALDTDAKRKRGRAPDYTRQWLSLVEAIKREEAGFYGYVKPTVESDEGEGTGADTHSVPQEQVQDAVEASKATDETEPHSGEEGPSENDLVTCDVAVDQQSSSSDPGQSFPGASAPIRSAEELGGYHSVSARVDAKRERARQETILRAERSRVVARKHLHCIKALQEIATRARRYLAEQYAERENPVTVEQDERAPQGDDDDANHFPDDSSSLDATTEPTVESEETMDAVANASPVEGDAARSDGETQTSQMCELDPSRDDTQGQAHSTTQEPEQLAHSNPAATQDEPAQATMENTVAFSKRIVESAVATATCRVVVAIGVAEMQALAQAFTCVVPETLQRLALLAPRPAAHADSSVDAATHAVATDVPVDGSGQ